MKTIGWWLLEGFIIGYAFNILVMTLFSFAILRKNKQYIPYEVVTIQPLVYKLIMMTIYRYLGLFYNLFIYSVKHRNGEVISKRLEHESFRKTINGMFSS